MLPEKQAENIYYKMYDEMLKRFGHNSTTRTSELNNIGHQLFGNKFLGSFPQDKLPKEIYGKSTKYAIINTDTSGLPGEHWTAISGMPSSNKIMIFDSFGRATKKLLPIIAKKGGTIDVDYDKEQKQIQKSCGQFSMAWLKFFDKYGPKNAKLI